MSKLLVDDVLPICCAAYNFVGGYTNSPKYEILHVVTNTIEYPIERYQFVPCCEVTDEDRQKAIEIKEYFLKYLSFSILGSTSNNIEDWVESYEKNIYRILNDNTLLRKDVSKLAKLPGYYVVYATKNDIKKKTKTIDTSVILDSVIIDKQCEVINVVKTKNYPGYNVTGIINECLVTWYSGYSIELGMYHIEKAVVKEKQFSYYANKDAYRLNNIKGYIIKK